MYKTMIGITTHNRKNLLMTMVKSLYDSNLGKNYCIRVYDDKSSEYGEKELRAIFPNAEKITINPINLGADLNTWNMYRDYLSSDCDYLFNADSDLLFSKGWLNEGRRQIKLTEGVLCLLNTVLHKEEGIEGDLLDKKIIGAAGTLFSRERIIDLVNGYNAGEYSPEYVDWGFCSYFSNHGKKIYCVKDSLVQHIGVNGFNSSNNCFAYGVGFKVDSIYNGQAINDMVECFKATKEKTGDTIGYFLFPFDKICSGSDVVIYGVGTVGRDYLRQIEQTQYCNVVSIVDKNYDGERVFPPETIRKTSFDYIVIATVNKKYTDEIYREIKELIPNIDDRIIIMTQRKKIRV